MMIAPLATCYPRTIYCRTMQAAFAPRWYVGLIASLIVVFSGASSLATPFRTIDGSGNNALRPTWGQAGTTLPRIAPAAYPGDGTGATFLTPPARPNARVISNALFNQTSSLPSAAGMTSGVWQWGQFIDHDIDLSRTNPSEPHMIVPPANDPHGMSLIPMSRSVSAPDGSGVRQQTNSITSFLDGSNVYGSDATRAAALRQGFGGRLRTSANNLLPTSDMAGLGGVFMDNGGNPTTMFVAGDLRANEQLGLTAMHTLFMREHNRVADALASLPGYDAATDDDLIYLKARSIVGAEIQAVTYNEFLPMLLGSYSPQASNYQYNPSVDPSIVNEFSTALYRVGHTMLNKNLLLAGEQGEVVDSIPLREAFFQGSDRLAGTPEMIDKLLMGLAVQTAQEIDTQMVDDVRNFLFAPNGGVGFDLASLNIERGRDHGLADYNTLRGAYGDLLAGTEGLDLSTVASFDELDIDPAILATLENLYGDVNNIDPWVGALAESHVEGTNLGPLLLASMIDQFTRLRDGDAFFYTEQKFLWDDEIQAIVDFDDLRLMDIVSWNTGMKNSPMDFFHASTVPEPATGVLALLLLAGGIARRRFRAVPPAA